MSSSPFTAIDLFSGCGGLTLGLKRANLDVLAAVELDNLAASTYETNHPRVRLENEDIRRVDPRSLMKTLGLKKYELDLLAGCPPCQGFSTLRTLNGAKTINDPKNDLIFQFAQFVKVFKPRAIMIENVPALLTDWRLSEFRQILTKYGYRFDAAIFDAADFGVPQHRRRMILYAARGFKPKFAEPTIRIRTVRDAIGKLVRPQESTDPAHCYEVKHSPRILELLRQIPKDGGSRGDLPSNLQLACHRRLQGFYDVYGRLSWSKPSATITSGCINPSKGRFLHPEENRAITLREAALLQSFPKSYRFDMSKGRYAAASMIGNAFPPIFAKRHAECLLGQIS